jgi:magnesium-transporting ATPase (P-type)
METVHASIPLTILNKLHSENGEKLLAKIGGVQGILTSFEIDPRQGIKASAAEQWRSFYGENRVPEKPATTYLELIIASLEDFTLRLLIGCAVLSIGIALGFQRDEELSWLEGTAILLTVVAVCNIQAIQDWTKERSFRRMNATSNNMQVQVIRDGVKQDISRYDVVVGDVIVIQVGDVLEADGLLLHGTDIETDESALTGEPEDIKKNTEEAPFLFSGSAVKSGSGSYLATAVGTNSVNGKITALVRGLSVSQQEAPDSSVSSNGDIKKWDEVLKGEEMLKGEASLIPDSHVNANTAFDVQISPDSTDGKKSPQPSDEKEGEEDGEADDKSVLRGKLDAMVARIAYFAFGSAGISTLVMLVRYVIDSHITTDSDWDWKDDPNEILSAIVTGIAIVVVAVPEGLPLAVTLALSLSMKKMLKDNNLVKHLDATETMGSATTICSDKTGTLTQNRMTVTRAYVGGFEFAAGDSKASTCGKLFQAADNVHKDFKELICGNIAATKAEGADIVWNDTANIWNQHGNKTDCAMLAFVHECGIDYEAERKNPAYEVIDSKSQRSVYGLKMYPFSSARKRGGQALPMKSGDKDGPCRLYIKGASEIVLALCDKEMLLDKSTSPMTEEKRQQIQTNVVEKYANLAMRTIALAYVDFPSVPDWDEEIPLDESERMTGLTAKVFKAETSLTFLGVMGIIDPIREGVPRALRQCNRAGVDVRMVTGDHKATAVAIAKDCGILRRGVDFKDEPGEPLVHKHTVLTGSMFRRLVVNKTTGKIDQSAFDQVWPHLRVLSRSSPEDKHTLVSGMNESRLCENEEKVKKLMIHPEPQVVAVTGDGTNDAPALRRADVGFAMKLTGTRVAQDAADILLMDDNFESVVKACMWGRNVYDSICKFLQFQLTVNVSAVTFCLFSACAIKRAPLSVVQMLWVNLIMDSLGALALASELPTEDLLARKPYGKKKGLLSYSMIFNIGGQSIYQLVVLIALLCHGAGPSCTGDCDSDTFDWPKGGLLDVPSGTGRGHHDPPTQHYSIIFNAFVFMQLFNWLNARKLHHELNVFKGVLSNPLFCAIWLICVFVQVVMVEAAAVGGGSGENKGFKTTALDSGHWLLCLLLGIFSLLWYLVIAITGRCLRPSLAKAFPQYICATPYNAKVEESDGLETNHQGSMPVMGAASTMGAQSTYAGAQSEQMVPVDTQRSIVDVDTGSEPVPGEGSSGSNDQEVWM